VIATSVNSGWPNRLSRGKADDGVGNIRLLERGNRSAESFTFTDARASLRWCSLVAPTIGAVMTGSDSSQANATCAREMPRTAATAATRSMTFRSASAACAKRRVIDSSVWVRILV
jgi:hypothetical protein